MFRVYYHGGETFSGNAFDAPFFGVLLILETDREHGRRMISEADYYVWEDGRWWGKDQIGLIDYLSTPGEKKVICGRMVSNEDYASARKAADSDEDFAERTGYHVYEKDRLKDVES